jgi:hypothetical protein
MGLFSIFTWNTDALDQKDAASSIGLGHGPPSITFGNVIRDQSHSRTNRESVAVVHPHVADRRTASQLNLDLKTVTVRVVGVARNHQTIVSHQCRPDCPVVAPRASPPADAERRAPSGGSARR